MNFQKFQNREKKHQRRLCASVGQTNFSKSRKIKGARCQSCQQLKKVTPNIDDKVSKVKKRAKFHHLHWRFHCVRFEATAWTGEIFPFLTTAIKCQEVRSISSFRTWATPAPSIWPDVSAEQRRVTVTLSWLNKIFSVWLTLAFSLVEMWLYKLNLIFISGLMQFDFPARFFQAKTKIGP